MAIALMGIETAISLTETAIKTAAVLELAKMQCLNITVLLGCPHKMQLKK